MTTLYRAAGVFGLVALILYLWFSGRLAYSEESGRTDWKAPARAAALPNPIPPDEKSIAAGRSLYVKECASCHGDGGHGNGPDAADLSRTPADLSGATVRQQRDGEIFWKITEGRKPMPRYARTFKEEERWNVVNYIRSLSKNEK